MFRRLSFLVVSLAALSQAHDVITTKITWTREMSRLVYKSCVSCHREGGTSFSLVKYEEARPWAKAIKEEVLARRMPPWNAVKGFGDFAGDKGLTQEQMEVFADWVEGGAPEGDPAYLPKSPRLSTDAKRKPGVPVAVSGSLKLTGPMTLAGIQPGDIPAQGALQVIAVRPDGAVEPLLWVQRFNPAYRQPYWFKTPLAFPAGTVIQISPPSGKASLLRAVQKIAVTL
jgi:hypothetical protein